MAQSSPERMDSPTMKSTSKDKKLVQEMVHNEFSGGRLMPRNTFTFPWIESQLEKEEPGKDHIFVKDAVYGIYNHRDALPDVPSRHTFLIRHPYLTMVSFRKILMRVDHYEGTQADYEFPSVIEDHYFNQDYMRLLWRDVQESGRDPSPIIIDAQDLINYPDKILPKYLAALGIPYRESYTTWDASEESIKTWRGGLEWLAYGKQIGSFDEAFASSCFLPKTHAMPGREDLTPDITGVIDRIMPGYEEMYKHRIKPE